MWKGRDLVEDVETLKETVFVAGSAANVRSVMEPINCNSNDDTGDKLEHKLLHKRNIIRNIVQNSVWNKSCLRVLGLLADIGDNNLAKLRDEKHQE